MQHFSLKSFGAFLSNIPAVFYVIVGIVAGIIASWGSWTSNFVWPEWVMWWEMVVYGGIIATGIILAMYCLDYGLDTPLLRLIDFAGKYRQRWRDRRRGPGLLRRS